TQYVYDSFGHVIQMTDAANNVTQYDFTDSFVDNCSLSAPTNAYLTKITYPPTGGVSHIESFQYYCATGELANSTDQNGSVTSYKYSDSLLRLTEIDYPPTFGMSTITYVDTPLAVSVETKRQIDATHWTDMLVQYDGLGQKYRSVTQTGN